MASKSNICSMALSLIGCRPVTSLDRPTTEEDRQCLLWWDHSVKEVLEKHDWKFARRYAPNLAVSTSPSGEYDHAYQLPNDCLVLRYLWDDEAKQRVTEEEYELQGRSILTNLDTVNIVYTKNDENTGGYPGHFVKALIFLLASYLAYKLGEKGGRSDEMREKYRLALHEAVEIDQAQGNYPEDEKDSWMEAAGYDG